MHPRITTPYARLEDHEIIPYLTNTLLLDSSLLLVYSHQSQFFFWCLAHAILVIYHSQDYTSTGLITHELTKGTLQLYITYYYQSGTASLPIFSLIEYSDMSNSSLATKKSITHTYFVPYNKTIRYECLRVPNNKSLNRQYNVALYACLWAYQPVRRASSLPNKITW